MSGEHTHPEYAHQQFVDDLGTELGLELQALRNRVAALEGQPTTPPPPAPSSVSGFAEHHGLTGGLGKPVYTVTNLNDSGPGSYRNAVSVGDRYVVLDVSGRLDLASDIVTKASNLTVDGRDRPDFVITKRATKFEGTNIALAGLHYADNRYDAATDAVTFRNAPVGGQLFGVYACTFEGAADAGVDVIWSRGQKVRGTIAHCRFAHMIKGSLVHSGAVDSSEAGGTYEITYALCHFFDVDQRMPLARNAHIHSYNCLIERYGEAGGGGGGIRLGEDDVPPAGWTSSILVEGPVAIPRTAGETTWSGVTCIVPRRDFASPYIDRNEIMDIRNPHLVTVGGATPTFRSTGTAFTPPYPYQLRAANAELADYIRTNAGHLAPRRPYAGVTA
jgi:pectate lyase